MSAFVPSSMKFIAIAVLVCLCIPLLGYFIAQLRVAAMKRSLSWALAVGSIAFIDLATADEPAGFRMSVIIGVLLYGMKSVIYSEYVIREKRTIPFFRWVLFHLWFGMRPYVFMRKKDKPYADASRYFLDGFKRLLFGIALVLLSWGIWKFGIHFRWNRGLAAITATAPLLIGLSFIVHFGVFNLVTGYWRQLGYECQRLFRNPIRSTSLNEFWGRRWNLAFLEMTALGVYRPLSQIISHKSALFLAFLFSGILHELAISLPVRQGFGLPMLYFILHGIAMSAERAMERKGRPISAIPWVGRVWTMSWLLVPMPILFHAPFLKMIVWPIVGIRIS
ncbi:wax synthase family protein [Cohnella lupini]|uniref:Membrane bound O-acyltransferase family protein n=1 Tax=Cohnella lupini TaxID=1294267 RepID=A0A3D9ISI5_9BACL|nr:membrane bound O-acyl transferase family-domain-containing protein [Cohnella lupini]RED64753.1 membrane bound O-acyltransferase family protein [Cohnella lupini]